ncbi:unnamed protein product [Schistosoma curassoni]|uniref:Secreted protein n=1 Tax=Schistosoma curassoni TaxID=6186 RepID=A0A183JH28_9TREM|nr:unnamed protein product [Schistosoma curassoni]
MAVRTSTMMNVHGYCRRFSRLTVCCRVPLVGMAEPFAARSQSIVAHDLLLPVGATETWAPVSTEYLAFVQ